METQATASGSFLQLLGCPWAWPMCELLSTTSEAVVPLAGRLRPLCLSHPCCSHSQDTQGSSSCMRPLTIHPPMHCSAFLTLGFGPGAGKFLLLAVPPHLAPLPRLCSHGHLALFIPVSGWTLSPQRSGAMSLCPVSRWPWGSAENLADSATAVYHCPLPGIPVSCHLPLRALDNTS